MEYAIAMWLFYLYNSRKRDLATNGLIEKDIEIGLLIGGKHITVHSA